MIEPIAYSHSLECIKTLSVAIQRHFSLSPDLLEINSDYSGTIGHRLLFLLTPGAFGAPIDKHLILLPKLKFYCEGFTTAYRR